MKKALKIALWVIVAAIFIGTFVYLWSNSQTPVTMYSITGPRLSTIEKSTVLTGTIQPRDEIELKPQVSGIISEISVEAGDMVREGDIVAKIRVVPDESMLAQARSRITSAEISLNDARTRHARNQALYEKKVISREEYEATAVEVSKMQEELDAANEAYVIVRDGASAANGQQNNTLVRATTSGLVLDVPVKIGSSVIQANTMNDGTTIATVADMTNLIFLGTVDETEVGNLSVNQPVTITIGAMPDVRLDAKLEYISPKSTSTSGANTFEVKAQIDVPDTLNIRAGYSANADVLLQRAADTMSLPESVVEFVGDSAYVYVVTDSVAVPQTFERRSIETGLSDGVNICVLSGIDMTTRLRGHEIQQQ